MRTRSSTTTKHETESTDDFDDDDDDDDVDTFRHRLYCAENEIARLSNHNGTLALKLQASIETQTDLTARINRLEALLPPPPPGHPVLIKTEPTEE